LHTHFPSTYLLNVGFLSSRSPRLRLLSLATRCRAPATCTWLITLSSLSIACCRVASTSCEVVHLRMADCSSRSAGVIRGPPPPFPRLPPCLPPPPCFFPPGAFLPFPSCLRCSVELVPVVAWDAKPRRLPLSSPCPRLHASCHDRSALPRCSKAGTSVGPRCVKSDHAAAMGCACVLSPTRPISHRRIPIMADDVFLLTLFVGVRCEKVEYRTSA